MDGAIPQLLGTEANLAATGLIIFIVTDALRSCPQTLFGEAGHAQTSLAENGAFRLEIVIPIWTGKKVTRQGRQAGNIIENIIIP